MPDRNSRVSRGAHHCTRRTETSCFLLTSLELKCHACFSTVCMLLYSNTRDACLFVVMHYIHVYMYECFGSSVV